MIISSLSSFHRSFDVRVYLFICVHSLFEDQNPPLFLLNPFLVKPPTFWNISNPLSNIKTPMYVYRCHCVFVGVWVCVSVCVSDL